MYKYIEAEDMSQTEKNIPVDKVGLYSVHMYVYMYESNVICLARIPKSGVHVRHTHI